MCMEGYSRLNSTACCHQDICELSCSSAVHRTQRGGCSCLPAAAAPAAAPCTPAAADSAASAGSFVMQAPSASSAWW